MTKNTLRPWKAAVVVSSLALACAFVAYAQWSVAPPETPPPQAGDAPADPPVEVPEVYLPGSKSEVFIRVGSGGLSQPDEVKTPPAKEPPVEAQPAYVGGSKSLVIPAPRGKGSSK
jgi:hypothetical protein